jgi:hypothetical protein
MSPVTHHPAPEATITGTATSAAPRPRSARAAARAALRDDARRHAVTAVQRALDRRDNGGSFGH